MTTNLLALATARLAELNARLDGVVEFRDDDEKSSHSFLKTAAVLGGGALAYGLLKGRLRPGGLSTVAKEATGALGSAVKAPAALPAPKPLLADQAKRAAMNTDEALRRPVDRSVWDKLDPAVHRKANAVGDLHNGAGTDGERQAAEEAWKRMRNTHGFSARNPRLLAAFHARLVTLSAKLAASPR